MGFRVAIAALLTVASGGVLGAGSPALGAPRLVPAELRDVTGATIDVAAVAGRARLVFVTLKAADCPVCRTQLRRLGRLLPHFRACGATFVVLAPGPAAEVAALARASAFPYPFVAEGALAIAGAAGWQMDAERLVPGFFVVDAARAIVWEQRGRSEGAFGDGKLAAYLDCPLPSGRDLLARAAASRSRRAG